jgi:hypothetical protein
MSLHRAVASLIATLSICCSAALNSTAYASTTSSTPSDTLYLAHTTTATLQNNGTESVIVYRNGSPSGAASVVCRTANSTALSGRDFTAVSTTLRWASGDATPKPCNVPISDATPFSGQRTFLVELSGPTGATLGSANKVSVTIYGNKGGGAVSVAAPSYTVAQNAGHVTISVNRTGGAAGAAVVFYATANKTAIAGTDYTPEHGMLSWGNGDAAPKSFSIPISNAKPFTGTKALAIAIAHGENVVLGSSTSAIVTIDGDQSKPIVAITAAPTSITSGSSATLTWKATNATACTGSGGWSGSKATSGTSSTKPLSESTTYTLNCTGSGGSAVQSATVAVASATPPGNAPVGACSGTSGPLTLKVSTSRSSGISPLLVFFDATGTTDTSISGKGTAFQDVTYTWNFGDSGASGAGTWPYGSNRGRNSRNTATGGVAAHLYVTPGTDAVYTVAVTAHNGTSTASCRLAVTAHDPAGSSGFAGTKTTCVSASGTPVPGSGGCPAGAAALSTSSFNTALGSSTFGSGKRVLFKCGDTFSGDNATLNGTTWSVGAYGGCEGTASNRPILRDSATTGQLMVALSAGDGRIADLDFEGNGSAGFAVNTPAGNSRINYQITLYNLYSNGNNSSYSWSQGAQWGLVDSVMTGMRTSIGTFVNYNENNPATWSGNVYNNLNYQALLGNNFNGTGNTDTGSGQETVRISACRMCVIENNTFENANSIGATLKLHNGNTNNSLPTWTGVYTELVEISDNWFGGTSGANLVENSPQNANDDERMRNIVFERNLLAGTTGAQGGRQLLVSAVNETVRDNVFYMPGNSSRYPAYGAQIAKRGVEPVPSGIEAYNNTCYAPSAVNGQTCIAFDGMSFAAPATNSIAQNNLFYTPAGGHTTVTNTGSGNTVSNNTASPSNNPLFTDGSGSFGLISDFKPTANYAGGTGVPVWYDALDVLFSLVWDLGAVHP